LGTQETKLLIRNHAHFAKHAKHIKSDQNRDIFWFFVGFAAALKNFDCEISWGGKEINKRSFRFRFPNRPHYPFSFIINENEGHLFYIRKSAFTEMSFQKQEVSQEFKSYGAKENLNGEISFKIENTEHAAHVTKYLFLD
jgi:hypothetical protein